MQRTQAIERFWSEYCRATGWQGSDYDIIQFGDDPKMADELLALVMSGTKRATASLFRDYGGDGPQLPKAGDHVVVLDGATQPRCIFRSREVRVGPLNSVDEAFAYDEGEGDRTLSWWREAHCDYFTRQAKREGFIMQDDIETVFERFEVVWPGAAALQSSR